MPEWTRAEANRMSKASVKVRRAQLRLQKKALSIEEKRGMIELTKTALQSPVLAGTAAFLTVHWLEGASHAAAAAAAATGSPVGNTADQRAAGQPPSGMSFLQAAGGDWLKALGAFFAAGKGSTFVLGAAPGTPAGNLLGGAANAAGGTLFDLFKNLDYAALKTVILLYIASGGNLAGLLQSSGGVVEGLIKGLGLNSLGAAIAP